MEGKGSIVHLEQLLNETTTMNKYQHLRDEDGNWTVRDDVRIKFNEDRKRGQLTVGYGYPTDRFGTELEFGMVVGDALPEKILIIKCAWGGKDLAVDFRSPSSGVGNYTQCDRKTGECKPFRPLDYGFYYRKTISIIQDTLANYKTPYILSGIVWFQGWNDLVFPGKMDEYGQNLANLIRDMRADLEAPNLPFIIGELGQAGVHPDEEYAAKHFRFRAIQKNVTNLPEFKDNTLFVKTSPYVVKDGETFDGGYHYNGRADTFFDIGHAFGKAMLQLIEKQSETDI